MKPYKVIGNIHYVDVLDSVDKAELEFVGRIIDSLNMVLTHERWKRIRKKA